VRLLHAQVRTLGESVFFRSALEQIQIPAAVTTIGQSCFAECFALAKVAVESPSYLKAIEPHAFQATAVKEIQLPLVNPSAFPSTEPGCDLQFINPE
jgi:hypothetical protein